MLKTKNRLVVSVLLLALAIGCDEDKRLVEQAREADERQAEQNRQIAHQNHELAEATNKLIEADAKSREELVALERDLQAERAVVGRQRDELEAERRRNQTPNTRSERSRPPPSGRGGLSFKYEPGLVCDRLQAWTPPLYTGTLETIARYPKGNTIAQT